MLCGFNLHYQGTDQEKHTNLFVPRDCQKSWLKWQVKSDWCANTQFLLNHSVQTPIYGCWWPTSDRLYGLALLLEMGLMHLSCVHTSQSNGLKIFIMLTLFLNIRRSYPHLAQEMAQIQWQQRSSSNLHRRKFWPVFSWQTLVGMGPKRTGSRVRIFLI